MNKYIIELPEKISTNKIYAGEHWRKRKAIKDLYLEAFQLPATAIEKPKTPCHIHFEFNFDKYPLDCTNCSYMAKLVEDCLVHYEILPDDSIKYISGVTIISKKRETRGNDYLEFYFKYGTSK